MKHINERRIFVAGHNGMVGSAICRHLSKDKNNTLILKNRKEFDLINQNDVREFFLNQKIDEVYIAAAKVGGIYANNKYPVDFLYNNLMIQSNIINSAFASGVKKLLFLGSSCIYPKHSNQPIKETELLNGKLEKTNEAYAIAKISGIKLCESYNRQYGNTHDIDYRCLMPTNLYGPGDNYHDLNSHVIPSLLRRFYLAKLKNQSSVVVWGSGKPRREFLYVDDLADAAIFFMNLDKKLLSTNNYSMSHINVGFGKDISIKEVAFLIAKIVGYNGDIIFDKTKPDGMQQKLLDSSIMNSLGWCAKIDLNLGLSLTYEDFVKNCKTYI